MKPLAIISTDWHIKLDNSEQSIDLAAQKIKLAKQLNIKTLICLGDVFESRKAQPEQVLHTFGDILSMIQDENMELILIPGNHDKTNYSSYKSYLDCFRYHPNLIYFDEPKFHRGLFFVPFFEEDMWVQEVEKYIKLAIESKFWKEGEIILLSHQAVTGSMNNDRSKVENKISTSLLKRFKLVLLGHYHNAQQPYENVYHLPSWKQNNFGEDNSKGFTILYDNGSLEFVKSKFKEYEILELDAGKTTAELVSKLVEEYNNADISLRVDFKGSQEEIQSLNLSKLQSSGIKVKSIVKEIQTSIQSLENSKVDWDKTESILSAFKEFCQEREIDYDKGLFYLQKVLNDGEIRR